MARPPSARTIHLAAALFAPVLAVSCAITGASSTGVETDPRASGRDHEAAVISVVDGDTIHVDLGGLDVTIRFIGIDTPETVAPGQPVECFGHEASAYTTERLDGETVRLEFDVERIDPYDRTLAYVWIDGELFNESLVRLGYALVTTYPPNVRYVDRFIQAQRSARREGAGLWGSCPP